MLNLSQLLKILFITFFTLNLSAQEIEIIVKDTIGVSQSKETTFHLISKKDNIKKLQKISIFNCIIPIGEYSDLFSAFKAIKKEGNDLDGNTYIVDTFNIDDEILNISFSIYNIPDTIYYNYVDTSMYENSIIAIGSINIKDYERKIKFNGEKHKVYPFQHMTFKPVFEEWNELSLGGFLGTKISFVWEDEKKMRFFYTTGFGAQPSSFSGIGISMNNGRTIELNYETAIFITYFMENITIE